MQACVDAGGSLTGEHGIGVEKQKEMCMYFNDEDLDAMKALKAAFDPVGFWNPGKMIPVRGCREIHTRALPDALAQGGVVP